MKLVWLLHIIHLCSFVERFWTSTKLSRHVRLLPDDILITQTLVRVMDAKIKFTETLTSGLESMLASGAHADVTIVVDGKVFPCHKVSTLFFVCKSCRCHRHQHLHQCFIIGGVVGFVFVALKQSSLTCYPLKHLYTFGFVFFPILHVPKYRHAMVDKLFHGISLQCCWCCYLT